VNFKNVTKLTLFVMVLTAHLTGLSFAGSGKATITVSANVVARVSQSIIHQVSRFSVTEEDIRRGFVEISSGTILQVKTNSRKGYTLYFAGENELFKEVSVLDKGRITVLSPSGGLIHQSGSAGGVEVKELSYRLLLTEDIQPGTYPFPFRVKASLL
jgi:hypothetical protein